MGLPFLSPKEGLVFVPAPFNPPRPLCLILVPPFPNQFFRLVILGSSLGLHLPLIKNSNTIYFPHCTIQTSACETNQRKQNILRLLWHVCFIFTAWKSCNATVDVAFIIDSSGSIARRNYKKIKTFVKYVARSFGISPNGTRAGIVLYSTKASIKAHFNQYNTTEDFEKAVDDLPHERGLTFIDKALDLASSQLFPRGRKDVPKVAMLLTDGEQTDPESTVNLRVASAPLRRQGVRLIAFGVGKRINVRELRLTVERDEDVIRVMKFDDLITKVRNYTENLCQAAGETYEAINLTVRCICKI